MSKLKTNYFLMGKFVFRSMIAFVFLYLILFYTPVMWWIAEPLNYNQHCESQTDLGVILAGGVGESGDPGQGYQERVLYGIDLYHQNKFDDFLFSSGFQHTFPEVEMMRILSLSLGVPDSIIDIDTSVHSTIQKVKNSYDYCKKNDYHSMIFVTSTYHGLRLHLTAKKNFKNDISYFVYTLPREQAIFFRNTDKNGVIRQQITYPQFKAIWHEYLAILYYKFKGYL